MHLLKMKSTLQAPIGQRMTDEPTLRQSGRATAISSAEVTDIFFSGSAPAPAYGVQPIGHTGLTELRICNLSLKSSFLG